MRVDTLLVPKKTVHLICADLHERPFRRGSRSSIKVLVCREVHDVLTFDVIDFRCPEPLSFCGVVFVKGKSFVLPNAKVVACIAANSVRIVCSVGIIGASIEQNIRVCQRNLTLAALSLREEREQEQHSCYKCFYFHS